MSRVKKVLQVLNTKKRGEMAVTADMVDSVERISTGVFLLDYVLGGGIPVGRISLFYGEEGSGKSTTALRLVAEAQRICSNCYRPVDDLQVIEVGGDINVSGTCTCYKEGLVPLKQRGYESKEEFNARKEEWAVNSFEDFVVMWIDAEKSFNKEWAERLGVDLRRLILVTPSTAEEAIDVYFDAVKSGMVDMVVLDSLAALTPSTEAEDSAEKWQQGLQARLINKLLRRITTASTFVSNEYGKEVTHILINQTREKIGIMFGDKTTLPGGRGQDFFASVKVKFWKSTIDKTTEDIWGLPKDAAVSIGDVTRFGFRVEKNRFFPPKGQSSFLMDSEGRILDGAVLMNIIESGLMLLEKKAANKWILQTPHGLEEFQRKGDIKAYLERGGREGREFRKFILDKMFEARGV